ncbi:hypothetical protein DID96_35430 [Burkholderia sp. Bp8963]|uniref:hypothetical protein n=1 Tax=Burkholderia sp. Bp8963 TaxID=2184547 RepID=UPI000F59B8A8|nr:hypothetical protein [Burkholderia sp. Bp8963]RQS59101.1 hypothetical protein DID96_35430 [Burkholderia sp. Bp8963]
MPFDHNQPRRQTFGTLLALVMFTTTGCIALVAHDATAQGKSPVSSTKAKPPALPNGSAHVIVKPGMSDEEWKKAYKETGRPAFNRKSVKRAGGNVERD